MAIDFPNSPTNGQTYTVGSFTWQYDGEKWIAANGITLDGLTDVTAPTPSSGDFLKWNGSAWVNDAIDLGTDTTGSYVLDVIAGTGISVTHTQGEGSSASVAIDSTVATLTGAQTLTNKTFALGSNTLSGTKAQFDTAVTDDNFAYVGTANTFTTNQVVEGSSASALLRITQTGSGNALLVEDSANPDATPFIIDASGRLVAGNSGTATTYQGAIPSIQSLGTGAGASSFLAGRYSADAQGPAYYLTKSRSATIGSESAVSSGDRLGNIYFSGSDGTNQILGVSIAGEAEGTISTGVVPGRFVFFTSGSAGTPTERMRIDSTGGVGIGGTAPTGRTLAISRNITGSTTSVSAISNGTIQSDVTVEANSFRSIINTAAASFTLSNLFHFYAAPSATPGAGSTITTQAGFAVASTMTGATNNYAFYGDLPAAAGRYNLLMNGTANNYLAGRLGVGATLTSGAMAQVVNTTAADKVFVIRAASSQSGNLLEIQDSSATSLITVDSSGNLTVAGNFTVNGTTTTINTTTLNVSDNIVILNNDVTGVPSENAGLEVERGTSTNVAIRWNETTDKWQFTNDGTTYSDLGSGGGLTVSASAPAGAVEGSMWFDSDTAQTYVYYDSSWVEIGGAAGGARFQVSASTPAAPLEGTVWFDSDTAQTFVYYDSQWVEVGASAMAATVSTTAPNGPIDGQVWFNSNTGGTYVYYNGVWVEVGAVPQPEVTKAKSIAYSLVFGG